MTSSGSRPSSSALAVQAASTAAIESVRVPSMSKRTAWTVKVEVVGAVGAGESMVGGSSDE
jgi:hypothetical protein